MNNIKSEKKSIDNIVSDIINEYFGKYKEETIAKMFLVNNECEVVELEPLKTLTFLDFNFNIDSYSNINELSLTEEEKKEIILQVLSLNIFELKLNPENPRKFCSDVFFKDGVGNGEYKVYVFAEDAEGCEPSVYGVHLNTKDTPYKALFFGKN